MDRTLISIPNIFIQRILNQYPELAIEKRSTIIRLGLHKLLMEKEEAKKT